MSYIKYFDVVSSMLNEPTYGFCNIVLQSTEYKTQILDRIKKSKCSIVTTRVFLDFVELKLEVNEEIKLDQTMGEAATLIGNGFGLDPTRFSDVITINDLRELKFIDNNISK